MLDPDSVPCPCLGVLKRRQNETRARFAERARIAAGLPDWHAVRVAAGVGGSTIQRLQEDASKPFGVPLAEKLAGVLGCDWQGLLRP